MREKTRSIKEEVLSRAGEIVTSVVRASLNSKKAEANAKAIREKYRGLPIDVLADILIKWAARKTKWEGAASGLGVTGCEAVVAVPAPEPSHKVAAGTGVVALLLGDIAYTTRIQIQLLLAIADLYGCPFDPDDEEDVWVVFKAALGLKGTERVGSYGRFIFTETARKQFRKVLRTGIRRAIQNRVVRIAGPRIGRYLGEKYVMRLVPFVNAAIGYAFNNKVTKSIGRWAKVKSKVRSTTFKQVMQIQEHEPEALVWVLPTIFYVGTADDKLTENVLTLYSQTNRRLPLDDQQVQRVESLIDDVELPRILAEKLLRIRTEKARNALYDIALTTAAVNFDPQKEHEECLAELAQYLKVNFKVSDLREKVSYFQR